MKRLSIIFMALLVMACSNQEEVFDDISQSSESQETYTVSFGLGNFDADVETRATATKTIYGINVYYDKDKDGKQDDIYAYGLFDNTNSMSITLIGGYKYRFVCSIVRDADDKLYYGPYSSNSFNGYAQPFQLSNSNSTAVQNKFVIGTSAYLSGLTSGVAVVQGISSTSSKTSSYYPSLERYYGEFADYEPVNNGKVIIPMKRTYFGNKVVIKGVVDGTVSASCYIGSNNTNNTVWNLSGITTDYTAEGSIYSYYNVSDCWKNESNLTGTVAFTYTSNRGSWWDLSGSKNITFKRNVMTTITITLNPDLSGGRIGVVEEELDDDNEIILKGDNGTLEDVEVSPSEGK